MLTQQPERMAPRFPPQVASEATPADASPGPGPAIPKAETCLPPAAKADQDAKAEADVNPTARTGGPSLPQKASEATAADASPGPEPAIPKAGALLPPAAKAGQDLGAAALAEAPAKAPKANPASGSKPAAKKNAAVVREAELKRKLSKRGPT